MIERKYYLNKLILDFFNGRKPAICISLAGHGIFIWAIIMFAGDISKPVPVQAFNVEVVVETAPEKPKNLIKSKIKSIKITPKQIAPKSPSIRRQSHQQLADKKTKKTISILPKTTKTNPTIRPIFAPEPKHKPDIPRRPSNENSGGQNIPKVSVAKILEKTIINSSKPKRKTTPQIIRPIIHSNLSGKVGSETAKTKKTIPTLPPKIDPKGQNLWPRYPRRARQRGIEGEILLRIKVNAKGRSSGIEVLKSSGHDILDEAAVDALKNWHFQPGRRGTTPVEASMDMPVVFRLK